MADIRDIPFEDIELFLSGNNITIPKNIDDMYVKASNLLKSGKADFYPDNVIKWAMAYNLIQLNINIPKYNKSTILSLSNKESRNLANLLQMKGNKLDDIIEILFYLHKLIDDSQELSNIELSFDPLQKYRATKNKIEDIVDPNMLSFLPDETIIEIMNNANMNKIEGLCNTSRRIKNICNTTYVTNEIIDKFADDSLDISKFTINEAVFYDKVIPLKSKIIISEGSMDVLLNNKLFMINTLNNQVKVTDFNVNQTIHFVDNGKINSIALTNGGRLIGDEKINNNKGIPSRIVSISKNFDDINLITATGKSYILSNNKVTEIGLDNIIQIEGQYVLTSNGDLYIMSVNEYLTRPDGSRYKLSTLGKSFKSKNKYFVKVLGLNNIIQITSIEYVLTNDGKVHKLNFDTLPLVGYNWNNLSFLHPMLNNIRQITSDKKIVDINKMRAPQRYLYNELRKSLAFVRADGKVVVKFETGEFVSPYYFNNIIDISIYGDYTAALDNEMKLHVIKKHQQVPHIYDLTKY